MLRIISNSKIFLRYIIYIDSSIYNFLSIATFKLYSPFLLNDFQVSFQFKKLLNKVMTKLFGVSLVREQSCLIFYVPWTFTERIS